MALDQKGGALSTAAVREKIKQLETDLAEQGVALFPSTAVGQRAHSLWCKIRPHLLRGGSIDVKCSNLKLAWHREELRRARSLLVGLQLIRPRADGLYVLGRGQVAVPRFPSGMRSLWLQPGQNTIGIALLRPLAAPPLKTV
jgi:hypothetical protein